MSDKYQKVKKYYDCGLWNVTMVRNSVVKKWITEDEFVKITGMEYCFSNKGRIQTQEINKNIREYTLQYNYIIT